MGQLPIERISPDCIFSHVGVDYAGPIYIKHGYVRKPIAIKAYICVFVSLSIKAVHIELVSDMTTEAFLTSLRHFIARRGKPILILSDHGTNFVGATRQLKSFMNLYSNPKQMNPSLISVLVRESSGNSFQKGHHTSVDCGRLL